MPITTKTIAPLIHNAGNKTAMKTGTRVTTPQGDGTIVAIEQFSKTTRYGVHLDFNPFDSIPIPYYFPEEIKTIEV